MSSEDSLQKLFLMLVKNGFSPPQLCSTFTITVYPLFLKE
uniref:Uncharacterized protein n=1 Tax=Anguilla anguilla TaxID=7936 RepID=A0A0E9XPF1_ANGAN